MQQQGVAGEAADLLRRSGAAMVAPPGDAQALADAIAAMADTPRDRREAMGRQGLAFYREILSFDQGMARTLRLLDGTYAEQRPAT